jgi:hypothetical protein
MKPSADRQHSNASGAQLHMRCSHASKYNNLWVKCSHASGYSAAHRGGQTGGGAAPDRLYGPWTLQQYRAHLGQEGQRWRGHPLRLQV